MVSNTSEAALEAHIEKALCGSSVEQRQLAINEPLPDYAIQQGAGYEFSDAKNYDAEFAIDTETFWRFLQQTQAEELAKLNDRPNWQRLILERLDKKIKKDGVLSVLKKGLSIDNAHLTLLYRQPYSDLNPDVIAKFNANIFSIARQVYYSTKDKGLSIDMVLFVNGLALITFELKKISQKGGNGQSVYNAMKQYRETRDPKEPLFQFGRCLVHFAVDEDDIYMTTKVEGKATYFLPFNKGNHHGKGNPVNEHGYRTAYLWEEVLTRRSLTNIIEHFAKLVEEKNPKTGISKKTLYFPRYQQLDVVLKLLQDAKENGSGRRYLIQHSAGSGKSNSIAWLAYQLIELYTPNGKENVFDSVVVVTDRRILDKQLKDNINLFSEVKNIVAHAETSQELKTALTHGKKLIITTIHKFPFILDGLKDLSERKFAVIIDEAHSSQDKSTGLAGAMSSALGAGGADEEPEDIQEKIIAEMDKRRMGQNVSFFAFTATPKNTTLEKFGIQAADGTFYPFHLYYMKQAIEEGFILDVLSNYSTYRSYYELQKSIEDNPLFNTKKAQKKLKAYVEAHAETIEVKADIMVNHFIEQVWQAKKLKGQAKAMVVTRNIDSAILYFFAIRNALEKNHSPCKAIIAFSGERELKGIKHTEAKLNGFSSSDIADEFDSDGYQFLVVANKFLTGFDQPKLHTMYVDKKLQGVLAVQALSRLNRCNDKLGKKDTFILDFYNSVEEIKTAFDDFYTATSLSQATDVNVLHDLKEKLDDVGIYEQSEVVAFNELFFNAAEAELLAPLLDTAVGRFDTELDDDQRIDFKIKAKQFVKIYAQVASLISFNNVQWEMLHWFLKFLIPKLKVKDPEADALDNLLNSVDLSTYGLERVKLNAQIALDDSDTELEPPNPNPRGKPNEGEDQDTLQKIINSFNERFFKGWDATPEEQRIKFINIAKYVMENPDYRIKVVDNPDTQNSQLALQKLIEQAIRVERKRELDLYQNYSKDDEFKQAFDSAIIRMLAQANSNELKQMLMVKT